MPGVGLLLLMSDSYSGWPEAIQVADRSAGTVLKVLRAVFARNGVPRTLVSDNVPEFKSEKVSQWLSSIGCQEVHTPPYPASNGQAERLVRSLKDGLKTW